jgi:hypothetical protein
MTWVLVSSGNRIVRGIFSRDAMSAANHIHESLPPVASRRPLMGGTGLRAGRHTIAAGTPAMS